MKEIVQQFVDYVASSQHHNKQTLIDDVLRRSFRNKVDAQQCHRFLDGLIDME